MRPGEVPEQRGAGDLRLEDQPRVGVVADHHQRPALRLGEQRLDGGAALLPVRRVAAGVRGDVEQRHGGLARRQSGQGVGQGARVVAAVDVGGRGQHPRSRPHGECLPVVPPEGLRHRHRPSLPAQEIRHQREGMAQAHRHQRQAGGDRGGRRAALPLPPAPPDLRQAGDGRGAERRLQVGRGRSPNAERSSGGRLPSAESRRPGERPAPRRGRRAVPGGERREEGRRLGGERSIERVQLVRGCQGGHAPKYSPPE